MQSVYSETIYISGAFCAELAATSSAGSRSFCFHIYCCCCCCCCFFDIACRRRESQVALELWHSHWHHHCAVASSSSAAVAAAMSTSAGELQLQLPMCGVVLPRRTPGKLCTANRIRSPFVHVYFATSSAGHHKAIKTLCGTNTTLSSYGAKPCARLVHKYDRTNNAAQKPAKPPR